MKGAYTAAIYLVVDLFVTFYIPVHPDAYIISGCSYHSIMELGAQVLPLIITS